MNINDYIRLDGNVGLLKVKVTPGQSKNEFFSVLEDGTLKIRIKAPAEKGKANKELTSFLAKELGVGKGDIDIVAGASDQVKIIKIKF
ncbi:MAG: DUF167 domain-containing protein [Candidatus Gracilibacteria bacterium]|nr:DUF167 domain-containing protein [Candidatus Gracilibacteria bacterium]